MLKIYLINLTQKSLEKKNILSYKKFEKLRKLNVDWQHYSQSEYIQLISTLDPDSRTFGCDRDRHSHHRDRKTSSSSQGEFLSYYLGMSGQSVSDKHNVSH